MIPSSLIKEYAREAGFSLCGLARSGKLTEYVPGYLSWLGKGFGSTLGYMATNIDKRFDPSLILNGARTVVVCAVSYKNRASTLIQSSRRAKVASYALCPDYHHSIKQMLRQVLDRIKADNPSVQGRCFVDSAPVLEKAWAVQAGLGWIGRNSLLVTPQYGSYVLLGEIIIDMSVDNYDRPYTEKYCAGCNACVNCCPANAIVPGEGIDTAKCISRQTVEKLAPGERPVKEKLHGWIFGCDTCQQCCPHNHEVQLAGDPRFQPVIAPEEADFDFWDKLTAGEFERIFGNTPMLRAGLQRIKSNL